LKGSDKKLLPTILAVAIGMSLGTVGPMSYAHGADDEELAEILARDDQGPDTDGDGIPDLIDIDDDNDGITDEVEGIIDADGNGVADAESTDTDGDGTPDGYDLDSDNDGILDIVESHTDLDLIDSLDIVLNGAIDIGIPVGANGLADIIETSVDSGIHPYKLSDVDGDFVRDFRDLDSDGDGIFDVIEAGGIDSDGDGIADGFVDLDGKGVNDLLQIAALPLFDTDSDGQLDFRDTDSDNDTLPDSVEAGSDPSSPTDTDNDGAGDFRESDSDNDGVDDIVEAGGNGAEPVDNDKLEDPATQPDPGAQDPVTQPDSGTQDPVTQPDPGTQTPVTQPNGGTQTPTGGQPDFDFDGDGVANVNDLDDDNDGILDTEEGVVDADQDGIPEANSTDSDGDGVPDGYDLDSDNDGILDIVEGRLPADRVNQIDPNDTGSAATNIPVGNNGVVDSIETATDSNTIFTPILDTDNDGTPNFQDIDSDSDGIVDLVEAGGVDNDFDGRVDDFQDNDNRGVDDDIQAVGLPIFDTDNDGIRDFMDLDSDQDSIPDQVESGGVFITPVDSDQDGAADYRESDSDNDGISDTVEAGPNPQLPVDSDGDQTPDFQDSGTQFQGGGTTPVQPGVNGNDDTDGDGTINSEDADDDNDGITDVIEGTNDNDSDGVPNFLDRDSDNDGVFDSRETAIDSDGDTVPDFLDLDSDNDGVYDAVEAGREGVSNTGRLQTAANVDSFGLAQGASDLRLETDGDGVVDMLDLDTDNDTLLDVIEAGFPQAGSDGRITPFNDANGDGADDSIPTRSTTLIDTDGDRVPDIRDLDSDQDGLSDLLEMSGPVRDQDNSGDVDNFTDANGDGLDDTVAANPTPQIDTDNDQNANNLDLDSDNDGISDLDEAGGVDANNDDRNDLLSDADLDGIPDQNDVDVTGGADVDGDGIDDTDDVDFVAGADSDGDGIVDSQDPDSDGDGFAGPANDGTGTGFGDLMEGQPINLPDANGDGISDITQSSGGGGSGIIETGLDASGVGCSISTVSGSSKTDPTVAFLLGGSFMFLVYRQRRRKVARVAVVAGSAMLAGCSTLGLDFDLDPGRLIPNDPDFEKRLYVGAGVLASQLNPDTDQVAGVSVADSDGSGGSVTIGYDFTNRISFEGHYASLGEAVLEPAGTVGYTVAGLSALFYGFNDERNRARRTGISAFGKLGVGAMENDVTVVPFRRVNDFHLLAGLGLEYGMENGFAVRGEFTAHDTDARYAQLGIIYRFGGRQGEYFPPDPVPQEPIPSVATVDVDPFPQGPEDNDADGVPDLLDSCPTTGVIEGINFHTNSDQLTETSVEILQGVAQTLREYPDVRVTVEAHTDNMGNGAISVARFLVDQGISGSRLKPQAYGESKPRTSNATSQGRAANRRVEFSVL